jgi:hypothetical protein
MTFLREEAMSKRAQEWVRKDGRNVDALLEELFARKQTRYDVFH